MSAPKTPIDLHATVKLRLDQITFIKALRLRDIPEAECSALDEGTSASFTQGVQLDATVAIFLDHWGWGRPHNRYSFAVFTQVDDRWHQVRARIECIDEALACAIHALTEQSLGGRS